MKNSDTGQDVEAQEFHVGFGYFDCGKASFEVVSALVQDWKFDEHFLKVEVQELKRVHGDCFSRLLLSFGLPCFVYWNLSAFVLADSQVQTVNPEFLALVYQTALNVFPKVQIAVKYTELAAILKLQEEDEQALRV